MPFGTVAGSVASGARAGAAGGPIGAGVGAGIGALITWLLSQRKKKQLGEQGSGTTPPWNPNAQNVPVLGQETQSWAEKYAPWLIGAGLGGASAYLGSRATGRVNEEIRRRNELMNQLGQQEMARREIYTSMLLPTLLQSMGIRNPQLAQYVQNRLGELPGTYRQPQQSLLGGRYDFNPGFQNRDEDDYLG